MLKRYYTVKCCWCGWVDLLGPYTENECPVCPVCTAVGLEIRDRLLSKRTYWDVYKEVAPIYFSQKKLSYFEGGNNA